MKRSEIFFMVLQVPLDFLLLVLAGISAFYLRFTNWAVSLKPVLFTLTLGDYLEIVSITALVWLLIFALSGLYSVDPNRKLSRDLTRVILACSTGLAVVALYIMFTQQLFDSRFLVAASWVFSVVYVSSGRMLMRGLKGVGYRLGWGLRRIVIIGSDEIAGQITRVLQTRKELGYVVVGTFPRFDLGLEKQLDKLKIDELLFTNPKAKEKEALGAINYCDQNHKVFKYSADLFSTYSTHMAVSPLAGVPVVELKRTPLEGWGRVAKRICDVIFSLIILVVASPLLLLIAVIILLETGRPVIYKNRRVGREYYTFKFRSMYQKDSTGDQFGRAGRNAEKREAELIERLNSRTGPIYKIASDPRVTRFGRFLRRWSLDELPQFFNVLAGSMSIVGPRPHQPREVEQYQHEYPKVFILKPGITGLAQISGRSDLSFVEEINLDIFYIERWGLLLDFIIFIKTPFVLFRRRRAL